MYIFFMKFVKRNFVLFSIFRRTLNFQNYVEKYPKTKKKYKKQNKKQIKHTLKNKNKTIL